MLTYGVHPRGNDRRRLLLAYLDGEEIYRDCIDTDSAFLRQKFIEAALNRQKAIDGGVVSAADYENPGCNNPEVIDREIIRLAEERDAEALEASGDDQKIEPPPCEYPFPVEALPGPVRKFVVEAAAAIGCSTSYVALVELGVLARAIGNRRTIRLKRSWQEPAIIWGAIIGKSGAHKSPAWRAAVAALERRQAQAIAEHAEALAKFDQDFALYEREYAAWKRSKSTEPPPWRPEEPSCARFIVSDITIEALADRLADQFDGVLLVRDELAGWLDGMAEYKGGKGSDTGHWLASWNAAPFTVDRKTGIKKTIHVPRAAVNIIGGIQPGILRRAIGKEHMQDGLCARLLLAMPSPRPIRWTEASVGADTEAGIAGVIDRLLELEPGLDPEGHPAPHPLPLTPEAKALWVSYYDRHRREMSDLDDDLAAAWSKLEAYAARLALIVQLSSWASGEAGADDIDEQSMQAGITLAEWFGNEARRVYSVLAEAEGQREVRELIELIERKGGQISVRDLAHCSRKHRGPGEAEAALEMLAKAKLGAWRIEPTAGRPRNVFTLTNPGNGNTSHESTEETDPSVTVTAVTEKNGHSLDAINQMLSEAAEADQGEV